MQVEPQGRRCYMFTDESSSIYSEVPSSNSCVVIADEKHDEVVVPKADNLQRYLLRNTLIRRIVLNNSGMRQDDEPTSPTASDTDSYDSTATMDSEAATWDSAAISDEVGIDVVQTSLCEIHSRCFQFDEHYSRVHSLPPIYEHRGERCTLPNPYHFGYTKNGF